MENLCVNASSSPSNFLRSIQNCGFWPYGYHSQTSHGNMVRTFHKLIELLKSFLSFGGGCAQQGTAPVASLSQQIGNPPQSDRAGARPAAVPAEGCGSDPIRIAVKRH